MRLDHRHLAFFFVGAVAVCAIFFSLGFVVGRGQSHEVSMKNLSSGKPVELKLPGESLPESNPPRPPSPEPPALTSENATGSSGKIGKKKEQEEDYHHELDFYNAVKTNAVEENFHPSNKTEKPSTSARKAMPKEQVTHLRNVPAETLVCLQVAALRSESDAQELAKTLRTKGYSVSVVSPGSGSSDKLIRIQVGPFTRAEEVAKVKAQLKKDGYQAITKR